jgi:hypothetical protein
MPERDSQATLKKEVTRDPMPKKNAVISPIRLRCPLCNAASGKACRTSSGRNLRNVLGLRVSLMHVARIKKAAKLDLIASAVILAMVRAD